MNSKTEFPEGVVIIAIVAIMIALSLAGCSTGPQYQKGAHVWVVDSTVSAADLAYLDAEWEDVAICYGRNPWEAEALVWIDEPMGVSLGAQVIKGAPDSPPGTLVWGWCYASHRQVHVAPDLRGWRHEAAEVWAYRTGASRVHGSNPECGM